MIKMLLGCILGSLATILLEGFAAWFLFIKGRK